MKLFEKFQTVFHFVADCWRFGAVLVLIVGLGVWWWLTPIPQRIRPANVGTKSFSVGWYTDKSSDSCILATSSWKLSSWVFECEKDDKTVHLLDIKGVEPENTYNLIIIDGLRLTWKKIVSVVTEELNQKELLPPVPAYGSVIGPDKESVSGALVYVYPQSRDFNYPLAVKTNINGNYALDISKIKDKSEMLQIEVVANAGIWNEMPVSSQLSELFPSIIVNVK